MDDEWTWTTWVLAALAFVPAVFLALGYAAPADGGAFSLVLAGAHISGLVLVLAAIPAFGTHLVWSASSPNVGTWTVVGFGVAFLAAPVGTYAPAVLPFIDAMTAWPTVLGWVITLGAFPIYWLRFVKPSPDTTNI